MKLMEAISAFFSSRLFLYIMITAVCIAGLYLLLRLYRDFRRKMLVHLSYTREFTDTGVYEGDQTELIETITNNSFMPLFFVDVEAYYHWGLHTGDAPANTGTTDDRMQLLVSRFHLLPHMQIRRRHTFTCLKRDLYQLENVSIPRQGGYLYLSAPAELYVYPRVTDPGAYRFATGRLQGDYISDKRLYSDPFTFSGIRDYRFGDPVSQINFKATARTWFVGGRYAVKVNQRDFCSNRQMMLYMDMHMKAGSQIGTARYAELAERALSISSALIREAVYHGFRVGWAVNNQTVDGQRLIRFNMASGEPHLRGILRAMAAMRLSEGAAFSSLLDTDIATGMTDTEVFLFCYQVEPEISERIRLLYRMGNSVEVISLPELLI